MRSRERLDGQTVLSLLILIVVVGFSVLITFFDVFDIVNVKEEVLPLLKTEWGRLWKVLLFFISIILTIQITGTAHEIGHYIVAKKKGFEVFMVAIPNLVYEKYSSKKIKFSFGGDHLGEVRVYPKEEFDYSDGYRQTLEGGIIASIIVAIVLNLILIFAFLGFFGGASQIIKLLFIFAPYSIYVLAVNGISWFHPENDGSAIKKLNGNKDEAIAIYNYYSILKILFEGGSYSSIPKSYFSVENNVSSYVKLPILVYALRRAIEIEDYETAKALSNVINAEGYTDIEIECECLCLGVLSGDEECVFEFDGVVDKVSGENSPIVFRTLLLWAKHNGDEEYIKVAKPNALKICNEETFCKGDALYNKKLIERI